MANLGRSRNSCRRVVDFGVHECRPVTLRRLARRQMALRVGGDETEGKRGRCTHVFIKALGTEDFAERGDGRRRVQELYTRRRVWHAQNAQQSKQQRAKWRHVRGAMGDAHKGRRQPTVDEGIVQC